MCIKTIYRICMDQNEHTSLWPPMNLVAECITISAPRARAFWLRGVANVPSMQTKAPFSWQSLDTRSMSTHLKKGFVGDSVKKRLTCKVIYAFINKLLMGKANDNQTECTKRIKSTLTLFFSRADSRPPISAGSMTVDCILFIMEQKNIRSVRAQVEVFSMHCVHISKPIYSPLPSLLFN